MEVKIVAEGLDHPECVTVDSAGNLFCGGEAGQLYSIDTGRGQALEISRRGGLLLGICINGAGTIYICDASNSEVYSFGIDGSTRTISQGTADKPMRIPNFPVLDGKGFLYVSDSGSWPQGGGCIYRVSPEGETIVWTTQAHHFTNGMALSVAGDFLYVVESLLPGVSRIPILPDGTAGAAEVVCLMPGTVPDGLAFDEKGRLYISCYRPDRVYRLNLDNSLEIIADDFQGTKVAAPTNVVFGGKDRRVLYLASLARWHVASVYLDVPGAPLRYPMNSYEGGADRG